MTVTLPGGYKHRYTGGGKGGKKWLVAMLKADIDAQHAHANKGVDSGRGRLPYAQKQLTA